MKYFCAILITLVFFSAKGQDTSIAPPPQVDVIYDVQSVEAQAEYPGGMSAMLKFLSTEIKYPKECADKEVSGKVYVEFVIDIVGKVTRVKIKRGVHPLLDAEAMRVVKLFPDWKPAINNGKRVRQRYLLPINFKCAPADDKKVEKK